MSLQRKINRQNRDRRYRAGPDLPVLTHVDGDLRDRWGSWVGENHPDKGKENGRCNRTACQRPLKDEPVHQFMRGDFTGGPRLFYCARCAADFDAWDFRSGDRVRITREDKVSHPTPG